MGEADHSHERELGMAVVILHVKHLRVGSQARSLDAHASRRARNTWLGWRGVVVASRTLSVKNSITSSCHRKTRLENRSIANVCHMIG